MGIAHGAFCVGCCWSLMLVMFGVGLAQPRARCSSWARSPRSRRTCRAGRRLSRPLGVAPDPGRRLRDRRRETRVVCSATWTERPTTVRGPAPNGAIARRRTRARAILEAARDCLLADGYANLSTRRVAEVAERPAQPDPLPLRVQAPAHPGRPAPRTSGCSSASARCSTRPSRCGSAGSSPATSSTPTSRPGYVRILQEMIAAGWSDAEVAASVREMIGGWYRLLADVARREQERGVDLGGFTPDEVAALMGDAVPGRRGADPARRRRGRAADALGAPEGRRAASVARRATRLTLE